MNVTCEKCGANFRLSDEVLLTEGTRFRCSKCRHVFSLYPPELRSEFQEDPVPVFEIIEDKDCPIYEKGDEFQLSGNMFSRPHNKTPCLILVKDLRKILAGYQKSESETVFTCSGCRGRICFRDKLAGMKKYDNYTDALVDLLSGFSIFDELDPENIREIVSFLRVDRFAEGDFVLKKGDAGKNLFIIISGRVDVLNDDGMSIAFMGRGEVFGEMSLLSGSPVGATVKVREDTAVLRIYTDNLRKVLDKFPALQMNFIHLLIQRTAEINLARCEEFSSGITGKLSEMPPADLFQTFNMGQKTGVLTLKLPRAAAYLSFREGKLVNVRYSTMSGKEAFFELLKQKEGRFKYLSGLSPEDMEASELGDFMQLLIEGLTRIDEDDRQFLRTVVPTLI